MIYIDIDENVNNINIIFLNKENNHENILSTFINNEKIELIKKKYKFISRNFVSYWYKNLEYIYEILNDNQCLFKYELLNYDKSNNYLISYLNEKKLPIYYFPSIKNISYKNEYILHEHKLNNRISLIIKENTIYIDYKWNKNIDIENNNKILNKVIKELNNFKW